MQNNQYEYTEDYGDNQGHFIMLRWKKWKGKFCIASQISYIIALSQLDFGS